MTGPSVGCHAMSGWSESANVALTPAPASEPEVRKSVAEPRSEVPRGNHSAVEQVAPLSGEHEPEPSQYSGTSQPPALGRHSTVEGRSAYAEQSATVLQIPTAPHLSVV